MKAATDRLCRGMQKRRARMPDEIAAAAESATVLKFDSQEEYEAHIASVNEPLGVTEMCIGLAEPD